MRAIISVILLVISFSVYAAPPSIAPDTQMLARIYELSQAPTMLRHAVQKRNVLKNMGQAMTAPQALGLDDLLDEVLNEPGSDERIELVAKIDNLVFATGWMSAFPEALATAFVMPHKAPPHA